MPVTVVVGAQFGDEAKGKITDYLAGSAQCVVRTAGGPNTGHTIHLEEGTVVLHQLSCGILRHGVQAVSGPGMVLQPMKLETEMRELEERGLFRGELVLSDRAHVLLPLHEIEDSWEDALRARHGPGTAIGTTRRGIGPAYSDRYGRWGIRLGELDRPGPLRARLELLYERKSYLPGLPPLDELAGQLSEVGGRLAPYIRPTEPLLWEAVERGASIVLEGAQSTLLDVDFGTYPYVTSSHPTSAGALIGSGLPWHAVTEVLGVAKAYTTRVGGGPFPSRADPEMEAHLQRVGGERGATTGRPRSCGWLDLVHLRWSARINGLTGFAITKVDALAGLDSVPVCVAYRLADGSLVRDQLPSRSEDVERATPVYERLPGWGAFHARLEERLRREGASALPGPLHHYLDFIASETGVPVRYVGYGPGREETVRLPGGALRRAPPVRWSA